MYAGDRSRKQTLIKFGFRLPSALDNRPLTFAEFEKRVGPTIYTSATPSDYERKISSQIVEQIIRPTGLVDPKVDVRPSVGQIKDFVKEATSEIDRGHRVIATTLTKKMAEDLSIYLKETGLNAEYLHSDIKTIERIKILSNFRRGSKEKGFDCLVGVNLLREGLDLPEVTLIGILDADKEGFLRSTVSLIQTIGRAARNVEGRVILYADQVTGSMREAIDETNRRRDIQLAFNRKHNITATSIEKTIHDISDRLSELQPEVTTAEEFDFTRVKKEDISKLTMDLDREMKVAAEELDFERAALIRDQIIELKKNTLAIPKTVFPEEVN